MFNVPTGNIQRLPMMSPIPVEERDKEDWAFYAEAIQSWRAWKIIDFDGVLLLQSITYRVNWIPRQEMIAQCQTVPHLHKAGKIVGQTPNPAHSAPNLDHGCGIYSLKSLDDAILWAHHPAPHNLVVYGRVSIWGNCFNYTKGYLSEFAYPSLIYVPKVQPKDSDKKEIDIGPEDLARELSETYRVEAQIREHTPYSTTNGEIC